MSNIIPQEPLNLEFHRLRREAMESARQLTHIPPGARLLLMELTHRQNQSWRGVWPSQAKMAETIGVSERSVRTYLASLLDARHIRAIGQIPSRKGRLPVVVYETDALADFYRKNSITRAASGKVKVIHKVIHNPSTTAANFAAGTAANSAV